MTNKKIAWICVLALLIAAAVGGAWCLSRYYVVDFRLYPKDAQTLDLRGQDIRPSHYEKIKSRLPGCSIRWDIPFQGISYPDDTKELTVTSLADEDVGLLSLFPALEQVWAENCRDYDQLLALQRSRPDITVHYQVSLQGKTYTPDTQELLLEGITREEIPLLNYLPGLRTVVAAGPDTENYRELRDFCHALGLEFAVSLGGNKVDDSTKSVTVSGATEKDLALLDLLTKLESVHLLEPQADAKTLLKLTEDHPETRITWEKTVLGAVFPSDAAEIDLTEVLSQDVIARDAWLDQTVTAYEKAKASPFQGDPDENHSFVKVNARYPIPDRTAQTAEIIAQLEEAMPYFPNAERVLLLGTYLDNEAMAAFREDHREDYKVVWMVECGKLATRTDTTYFMPIKYHVYYFHDEDCVNLKYCEEIISLDIGHMMVADVSFVEYMPNLKHLILAHTAVRDLTPLSSCKNLLFLEVDWTGVQDFTPLQGCTALQDLNVGNTFAEVEPLAEMTWLKNLWMVGRSTSALKLTPVLTDTKILCYASATVGGGWRDLPNYFAMRDQLLMFYMKWG